MKFEIVNRFSNARQILVPSVKKPFTFEEIKNLLIEAAKFVFPRSRFALPHSKSLTSIRIFCRFLEFTGKTKIVPDENLLEEFKTASENQFKNEKGKVYVSRNILQTVDLIRLLLNKYLYEKGLIQRQIFNRKAFKKYGRFLALSKVTQDLILDFEEDGRCIHTTKRFVEDTKSGKEKHKLYYQIKTKRLSDYNRKSYIDKILTFLYSIHKTGVEHLTSRDLDSFVKVYRENNREETAKAYLAALYSFIANGIAKGKLENNPFDNFHLERRTVKSREDFVMPDQIERLLDLKSLDKENCEKVRNRLISVLIYDTGLRASTVAQLECGDVKELPDGRYQITVKGVSLKGKKQDKILHLLFHSTLELLRNWLNISRKKLNPKTSCLFVSFNGKPLTRSGIRLIVRDCCKELGIVTVKKKAPNPHILRHTLATLNIEPFGKSLSPRLMQQRLIHIDLETLERNYVHSNPLAEMEEYKRLLEKDFKKSAIERVSKEDFFAVLDFLSLANEAHIKETYERKIAEIKNEGGVDLTSDKFVEEGRILTILGAYKFDVRTLRKWGCQNKICRQVIEGDKKRYFYDEKVFNDIIKNYFSHDEALRKFRGGKTKFYKKVKLCRRLKIGRFVFISKDDFLKFLIDENENIKVPTQKFIKRSA